MSRKTAQRFCAERKSEPPSFDFEVIHDFRATGRQPPLQELPLNALSAVRLS
jgi:hypothetical protein